MKKSMIVASLLASISAIAGDYGFRDYLTDKNNEFMALDEKTTVYEGYAPSANTVVSYCAIIGGNMSKSITSDLGTEEIKAIRADSLVPLYKISKEDRIAKYAKDKESMELKYTDEFRSTVLGSAVYNTYGIGGKFECKDPSGKVLFSAHKSIGDRTQGPNASVPPEFWVVEHNVEPFRDKARLSVNNGHKDSGLLGGVSYEGTSIDIQSKLNEKYSTYESYFDDWLTGFLDARSKQKLGINYRFLDAFKFDTSFRLQDSMDELVETQYFCEAKQGRFMKDGKPFRTFLKQFYLDGAHSVNIVTGYGTKPTSPFEGNYECVNTAEAFTLQLKDYSAPTALGFQLGYALVKKGGSTSKQPSAQAQPAQYVPQNSQQDPMEKAKEMLSGFFGSMMGGTADPAMQARKNVMFSNVDVNMDDMNLVANAVVTKAPFGSQQGANVSLAQYNGKDQSGCDLVAIEKSVANVPQSKRINNYKVCNGQVIALGETGLPGLPRAKEIDLVIVQVKSQCKAYGAFGSQYQDTIVSCRALDQDRCNLEITVMQNGKLLNKSVEKSCN